MHSISSSARRGISLGTNKGLEIARAQAQVGGDPPDVQGEEDDDLQHVHDWVAQLHRVARKTPERRGRAG